MAASTNAPRIAVVGCGRIAEVYHLPALVRHPEIRDNLILVDRNEARLHTLTEKFQIPSTASDYQDILAKVDGAVIATPHHLHYSIAMDFLASGVHVLSEKPLAEASGEARMMIDQAKQSGAALAVNHTRRLFPAYQRIKEVMASGEIGEIISIKYADGKPFRWATESGFYFQGQSSSGVLLDKGVHGLDALCWWLGGKPTVAISKNDSFGGREAVAKIQLLHKGCAIEVEFSWLNQLANTFTIVGERGKIEGGVEEWDAVTITYNSGKKVRTQLEVAEKVYNEFAQPMLDNFVDVVRGQAAPLVPAQDVLPSIELIEECYKRAVRFRMPWLDVPEFHDTAIQNDMTNSGSSSNGVLSNNSLARNKAFHDESLTE